MTPLAPPPLFNSTAVALVAGGPVTSAAFTPPQAGTYRWVASYGGDANSMPVAGACNDPNESTVVSAPLPPGAARSAAAGAVRGSAGDDRRTGWPAHGRRTRRVAT